MYFWDSTEKNYCLQNMASKPYVALGNTIYDSSFAQCKDTKQNYKSRKKQNKKDVRFMLPYLSKLAIISRVLSSLSLL